ncbi:hypothetical protein COU91_00185 [Candidatus Saccharibacteria bacterium CG10_big_fil_rev_8_21_14_0_10_47_8]|nr:MAG: hypothetical protein COU91_00185 [Candidatus Saccharibacteria bacterium CG10_big_fil_rev_8_21_14_0_10_47_8]
MISHKQVEEYLLGMPDAKLDYPFGEEVAVYKVMRGRAVRGETSHKTSHKSEGKIFALVAEKSEPVRISLKCDPLLAETLREKYETVMPGYHLNKKHWNTIVLSGQLNWEEVQALVRLSYDLVTGQQTTAVNLV